MHHGVHAPPSPDSRNQVQPVSNSARHRMRKQGERGGAELRLALSYMEHFAQVKNDADAVIKSLGQKYDKIEFHLWSEEGQHACIKATYERTIAKLFLNGLLGRNNMKLDRM